MSTNDYVKYMTEQFVRYMDQPKEERRKLREQKRQEKPPFLNRWFGMLPLAISMLFKRK
ncbi:YqzE family protein [Thermolongibacillus altinsuensis]|uniref:YqzE family protein n=1 Tax=Thermolongibacillus altinsuensis TaxID=575256 RepID=UPI00242A2CBC|nr:YqzE family protein [Thermolongibacillus altinsuensis]GMB07647.1 YqzE family protein [Thermolongibacillus altinsuensis]